MQLFKNLQDNLFNYCYTVVSPLRTFLSKNLQDPLFPYCYSFAIRNFYTIFIFSASNPLNCDKSLLTSFALSFWPFHVFFFHFLFFF